MIRSACKNIKPAALPQTWTWEEQPKLVRVEGSDSVCCKPESFVLSIRNVQFLTATYDCPFCGLQNEVVIADWAWGMRYCSHCSAMHVVNASENPPWINCSLTDGGKMEAEVIPLMHRVGSKRRKSA